MDAFHTAPASPHSLRVTLEPPERARYWSRVLDVSEDELRQVVGEVGPRAHRVCARLWELRQPSWMAPAPSRPLSQPVSLPASSRPVSQPVLQPALQPLPQAF